MSVSLRFNLRELTTVSERLATLADLDEEALLETIGAEVETQTRRRLSEEKTAPDGTPWPAWSRRYERTRHGGQGLLMSEGDLHDSIQYLVTDGQVEIGSNLVYAAIHNFGGEVQREGGTRTLYFRRNLRTGEVGNRFVRAARSNFAQDVEVGEYRFEMPQREYLGLSADNETDLLDGVIAALNEQLTEALAS